MPKAHARENKWHAYSKSWLARFTPTWSRSLSDGRPSGNSELLKGCGSPLKRLISRARLAVPQTGARWIHKSNSYLEAQTTQHSKPPRKNAFVQFVVSPTHSQPNKTNTQLIYIYKHVYIYIYKKGKRKTNKRAPCKKINISKTTSLTCTTSTATGENKCTSRNGNKHTRQHHSVDIARENAFYPKAGMLSLSPTA